MEKDITDEEFRKLTKSVLRSGKFGRRPVLTSTCHVEIEIKNYDSNKNYSRGKTCITIGDSWTRFDRFLERCLQTMHAEEESQFVYSDDGKEIEIVITLISFEEKPYLFQWSEDEKLNLATLYKDKGVALFKEKKIEEAFYKFSTAFKFFITMETVLEYDEFEENINILGVALYNNLATCQLHYKNYQYVIELCSNSLNIKPSVKALYRRAVAYIELKEYEKAENDLIELLKIEPTNKAGIEKLTLVRELDRPNRENYQSIIKNMFR